jgi:AcrR family transcriptional regulator
LERGADGLTTTRVAERAGVSVGSLYQYFPNKRALMASLLDRHLESVVLAVEAACERAHGRRIQEIGRDVVRAFVVAKLSQRAESAALYAASAFVGGDALVQRRTLRAQQALVRAFASASGPRLDRPELAALVLTGALVGPVQALLAAPADEALVAAVSGELEALAVAYLEASAR